MAENFSEMKNVTLQIQGGNYPQAYFEVKLKEYQQEETILLDQTAMIFTSYIGLGIMIGSLGNLRV